MFNKEMKDYDHVFVDICDSTEDQITSIHLLS